MHGRGQMLETGTPVRVDGSVGGGSRLSLTSPADIRRFRVAQALKSIENALILLDSRPAEGVEYRVNLYRCQGRDPQRVYIAWQPTGATSFHIPEKFGSMKLT